MKKPINELAKLRRLAGLITESEYQEEVIKSESQSTDIRDLVSKINTAKKSGKEIALNGEPVTMWVASMGRLKTATGTYNIHDVADGDVTLTIDGQPVELKPYEAPNRELPVDTRSPEEKAKAAQDWQDRYGPGGGQDTFMGRRTFDEGKEEEQFGGVNEGSEDEIPLTPKVKKFIDKAIADAKRDGEFEYLVDVDYFDNDLIDFIIDEFDDDNDYDDVSQEVKDYISKAISVKESQMNEELEPHVYDRMDGLVSQTALKALIQGAQMIIRGLDEEGFDEEDIYDFIVSKIKTLE